MDTTIIQDSLKTVGEITEQAVNAEPSINWWMWIAFAEAAILLILFFAKKSKPSNTAKDKFKKEALNESSDFDNTIYSAFHAKSLYDELKVKCHPDRFPTDSVKNEIADKLFQEITKNQTNAKRLKELKAEAIQKLNITFEN